MQYMITIQLDGWLVCSNCFCTLRIVVDGPISVLKVTADGRITEAFSTKLEDGKRVSPFSDGNKRDVAMSFLDGAC
jgi:hypothetical protein